MIILDLIKEFYNLKSNGVVHKHGKPGNISFILLQRLQNETINCQPQQIEINHLTEKNFHS